MTTVTTPGGTPTVIYNREGATIDSITAAGSTQGTATAITRYSALTIVVVDNNGSSSNGCIMPSDAEIGDVVEVHNSQDGFRLYPESGGQIGASGTNSSVNAANSSFRRTASGQWNVF